MVKIDGAERRLRRNSSPLVAGRLCWWRGGGSATVCPLDLDLSTLFTNPPIRSEIIFAAASEDLERHGGGAWIGVGPSEPRLGGRDYPDSPDLSLIIPGKSTNLPRKKLARVQPKTCTAYLQTAASCALGVAVGRASLHNFATAGPSKCLTIPGLRACWRIEPECSSSQFFCTPKI